MAVHHLLLSLLGDGPSYGYELKTAFERTVGPQWGDVNIGHVYQLLKRLERDGLIAAAGSADPTRGPERQLYATTASGQEELRRWLATPTSPPAGYRTETFLKLAAAAKAGLESLERFLRADRHAALAELRALKDLAAEEDDALVRTLIDGAAAQVEARLAVLATAESRRAALVAGQAATRGVRADAPAEAVQPTGAAEGRRG